MSWKRAAGWLEHYAEFVAAFAAFFVVGHLVPPGWGIVPLAAAALAYYVAKRVWP